MQLTGKCLCGGVSYATSGKPLVTYYCHCNDCKKSTGSAFHVGFVVKQSDINIKANDLREYTKTADSGNQMTRRFCGDCGSPLFTIDSGKPENLVIKAGSLDDPSLVSPSAELWTCHKVAWANISNDVQSLEKGKAYELAHKTS